MTRISTLRTVKREAVGPGVFSQGKHRPVIVSMEWPNRIGFRLKGTRRTYELLAEWCYVQAVRAQVASDKAAKREARKAKARNGE